MDKTDFITTLRKELEIQVAQVAQRLAKEGAEDSVIAQLAGRSPTKLSGTATQPGIKAARWVRALAASRGDPDRAVRWAEATQLKSWRDTDGEQVVEQLKAVVAGEVDSGGFMLPEVFINEIVELLRARSVVRSAGPVELPLVNGQLTIPRQTQASTATYVGEGQDIPTSEVKGDQLVMTAKKLTALVPISNDLLSTQAGAAADTFVRNDMVRQIAIREDQAFLRGDGTVNTPKGIRNLVNAANVTAISGTASTDIETDLEAVFSALEQDNFMLSRLVVFLAPRTKNHFMMLREATSGDRVFPGMASRTDPRLMDIPVFASTNVPINLSGTNSEMIFVDMDSCILAEQPGIEIVVDGSASYNPGTGMVSAFQRDETLIRAITRHDFAMTRDKGGFVYTGVSY